MHDIKYGTRQGQEVYNCPHIIAVLDFGSQTPSPLLHSHSSLLAQGRTAKSHSGNYMRLPALSTQCTIIACQRVLKLLLHVFQTTNYVQYRRFTAWGTEPRNNYYISYCIICVLFFVTLYILSSQYGAPISQG